MNFSNHDGRPQLQATTCDERVNLNWDHLNHSSFKRQGLLSPPPPPMQFHDTKFNCATQPRTHSVTGRRGGLAALDPAVLICSSSDRCGSTSFIIKAGCKQRSVSKYYGLTRLAAPIANGTVAIVACPSLLFPITYVQVHFMNL